MVKHSAQIVDVVEWLVRQAGAPEAAGVIADYVVVASQLWDDRIPETGVDASTVEQDERAARTTALGPQRATIWDAYDGSHERIIADH